MKKIMLLMLTLVSMFVLAACGETLENVDSISLNGTLQAEYTLNQDVSLDEFTITAYIKGIGGTPISLNNSEISVTNATKVGDTYFLNTAAVGTFTFKVEYKGFKVEIEYTVVNPAAWDGELAVEPAKDGDTFLVASAANYKWIVDESNKAVDPLKPASIRLTADIDFNGKSIDRIQMVAQGFEFDGDNHSMLNLPEDFRGIVNYLDLSHEEGKAVTFKDVKILNVNLINTFSTGLLAYGPRSDSNGFALTKGIINVVNVEITGKAVLLGSINSLMFGYIQSATDSTRTIINVTNSKMAVTLTSSAENVGLFVGHGQALLKLDQSTKTYVDANSQVVMHTDLSNRRFYHGNSNGAKRCISE